MKDVFVITKLSLLIIELSIIAVTTTIKSIFKRNTIVVNLVNVVFDEANYEIYWLK